MSDTISELGHILVGHYGRDAVHIAVAPVIAAESLKPGEHVGFVSIDGATADATNTPLQVGRSKKPVGIVDPYLRGSVRPGEQFWLFLYPATITSLRHEWTHPAFPEPEAVPVRSSAEAWLRDFAEAVDLTYSGLMEAARNYLDTGEYYVSGYDTPERAYTDIAEFWRCYREVTGQQVSSIDDNPMFFRCAC